MNAPLKPQDIAALAAAHLRRANAWSYQALAAEMGVSASYLHGALARAEGAQLFHAHDRRVNVAGFLELVEHGIHWVFYAELGAVVRGIPTAHSAPLLSDSLASAPGAAVVWPYERGKARGQAMAPLYPKAVELPKLAPDVYDVLTLIDAVRLGRSRDARIAMDLLRERMGAS